jgi:peptide/nickel transport system ATP-binding protein
MGIANSPETDELLHIEKLTVGYETATCTIQPALQCVTFSLKKGQCAAILGESGSGKTTLARAIVQLLPPAGRVIGGHVLFCGLNLTALPERRMQTIRGTGIAMLFQESALALNPVMRAIDQVVEVIRAHSRDDRHIVRSRAKQLLEEMYLADEYKVELSYPHQMSGGQRQRLMLAMSLASKPKLLIADEPTSSVDDEIRTQIILMLKQARDKYGLSVLWITHDPQDLTDLADRVLVFYAGQLVEDAAADDLMARPLHPYTRLLLSAAPPAVGVSKTTGKRLPVFRGPIADVGCPFAPRCPERLSSCSERLPLLVQLPNDRLVRCLRYVD